MPKILSYDTEIHVEKDGRVFTIEVSLPDWAPDDVVVEELMSEAGVGNVGDLLVVMRDRGRVRDDGLVGDFYLRGDRELFRVG